MDSYNNLKANIVNELKTRSLDHLIPIINSIILEITDVIKNHLTSINLFSDQPDSMKKDLLEMIINCPYTNVLKMFPRVRMSDLSFIIFNHPIQKNYFNSYFSSFGIKSPTFNALRHRISTLTIEDFRRVGLGDEIDDYTLRKLKQHAENAISDWINKYKKISFEGVGTTYRTEELRKLQFDVFNALWKAVAYHEEDFFISYTKVFHTLGYSKETAGSFYTQFITNSLMMGNRIIRGLMNKLDQFILEESYITPLGYSGIVNMEPSQQVSQQVYSEAKELLIQYQKSLEEAQNTWLGTEHGARSWFDGFFEIFSNDPRYTKGFKKSEIYKAWLVVMELFESFGTDHMTGESIPNGAFDIGDKRFAFASHHMDRGNKMSNALYDIFLTWGKGYGYHPDPYESFSELNGMHSQRLLKYRLRKLFEMGIDKDKVKDNIQNEQWITVADFRAMFPDNLEYEVEYKKTRYKGSLYYLWNDVFTDKSFQEKLKTINYKITRFREARREGENPYVAMLSGFYPAAESRFLEKASTFSDRFWMLGSEYSFSDHSADELARIWQVYLMKVAFDLD